MDAGYTVLKHTKDDGAYVYGSGAYTNATGATGLGGHLYSLANPNSWSEVRFINIVGTGETLLPAAYTAPADNTYMSTGTVIGGATPNGDIRGEGTGYVGVGASAAPYTLSRNDTYTGALYAIYQGDTTHTGKVGIGTNSAAIAASGYYEGAFTTLDIREFDPVFNVDTGDLVSVTTGSGVHRSADVTLQFALGDPAGGIMTSSSAIEQNSFISGQKISILDITGGLVFPNYRITTNSIFTFTSSENADVFGTYTKDFGVRNDVVNFDGTTQRSEFYLYGNDLYPDKIVYQASGGTYLNESDNTGNFSPPSTAGMSAAYAADAIQYFNNQVINTTGVTGRANITVSFMNDPAYTQYGNVALWSTDSPTTEGNLLGVEPLQQVQKGQSLNVHSVPYDTDLTLKLAFDTPEATTQKLYPLDLTILRSPQGEELFFPIEGGTIFGQVYIDKDLDGNGGCLSVEHYATHKGGGKLKYSATQTYTTTEDIPTCCTLEETTSAGSWTTNNVTFGSSSSFTYCPVTIVAHSTHNDGICIYDYDDTSSKIIELSSSPTEDGLFKVNATDGTLSIKLFNESSKGAYEGYNAAGDTPLTYIGSNADGGLKKVFAPDGTLSVKLFNESSKGGVETLNAAGDKPLTYLGSNANGGLSKGFDTDGNKSYEAGSDGNKRGFQKLFNVAGTQARVELEVTSSDMGSFTLKDSGDAQSIKLYSDSSKNAIIEANDGAGIKQINIDTSSASTSFLNVNKLLFGATTPQSNSDYEVAYKNSVISAYNSKIFSTGCVIIAGSGHMISGDWNSVVGGTVNDISGGNFDFIGGGSGCCITGSNYSSTIGGYDNDIKSSSHAIIAGGYSNILSGAGGAVLGGGFQNTLKAQNSVIVGGQYNTVHEGGTYSFIGAGGSNIIRGQNNVIGGGTNHEISGDASVIVGGVWNEVKADNGLAAGNYSRVQAGHSGAFVLSDGSVTPALSSGANTLGLHFENGVYVESTSGLYLNGVPVMTGVNPYDEDTLQTVTDRGNTTTTSMSVEGQYLSGVTGVFDTVDITGAATLTVTGNVGIGTANPSVPLHIATDGALKILLESDMGGGAKNDSYIDFYNRDAHWSVGSKFETADPSFRIASSSAIGTDDRLTILSDGKVGIGTTNPSDHLDLAGGADISMSLDPDGSANEFRFKAYGSEGRLGIGDGTNPSALNFLQGGNVGIQNSNPQYELHVSGSVAGTGLEDRITLNGTGYLLSGDVAGEADTLQTVTTRGHTTSTSILSTGPHISGVTGLFSERVGIGIDAPTKNLHIAGTMQLDNTVSDAFVIRLNGSYGLAYDHDSIQSTNAGYDVTIGAGRNLLFNTYDGGFNEVMRLDTDGNVGIGTTAPLATLDVRGDISGSGSFLGTGVGNRITNNGTPYLLSGDSPAETQTLQDVCNNGNTTTGSILSTGPHISGVTGLFSERVGIGTSSPTEALDVVGTVKVSDNLLVSGSEIKMIGNNPLLELRDADSTSQRVILGNQNGESHIRYYGGDMVFLDNGATQTVTIQNSDGYVGIGTSNPAYRLDVSGDVGGTGVGDRITLGGTPYLLSGDAAAALTLQDVCDNDNSTTTSILSTGPHISGVTGMFSDKVNIGTPVGTHSCALEVAGIGTQIIAADTASAAAGVGGQVDFYGVFGGTSRTLFGRIEAKKTTTAGYGAGLALSTRVDGGGGLTERITILESGNVGIGTDAPSAPLHIDAQTSSEVIKIEADNDPYISFLENGVDKGYIQFTTNDAYIQKEGSGPLYFRMGSTNRVTIENGGNVGIGTTNPAYKLHLNDDDTSTLAIQCNGNNATGSKIRLIEGSSNFQGAYMHYDGSANKLHLGVHENNNTTLSDDTDVITIDRDTTYVGIGSASPTVELDVASTGFDGSMKWTSESLFLHNTGYVNQIIVNSKANSPTGSYLRLTEGATSNYQGGYIQYDGLNNNLNIGVNDGGTAFTHDIAAITIERETAYVGIGTNAPITQLDVIGTGLFSDRVGIGTDAPNYPLEVVGDALIDKIYIKDGSSMIDGGGGNYTRVHGTVGVDLTTWLGGFHEALSVRKSATDALIGINDGSPSYQLDVNGTGYFVNGVLGTGAGNRITNNGVPYLLSGDSPAETQTLQDVCNNGNTTTGSIAVHGQYLSGVTGVFESVDITGTDTLTVTGNVGIGTTAPAYPLQVVGNVDADRYYVGTNTYFGSAGTNHGLISVAATSYGLSVYCNNDDLNINTSDNAGLGFSNGHSESYNTVDARFFRHSAGVIGLGTTFGSAANGTLTVGDVGIGTTAPAEKLDIISGCLSITSGTASNIYLNSDTNNAGEHEIKYGFYANKSYPVSIVGKATAGHCRGTLQIRVSKTLSDSASATSADTVAEFASGEVVTYQKLSVHDDLIEMGDNYNAGTKAIKFSRSENKAAIWSVPLGAYGNADMRFTVGNETTSAKKTEADATVRIAPEGGMALGNAYLGESVDSGRLIVEDRVGIGTEAPASALHVESTSTTAIRAYNGAQYVSIGANGNAAWVQAGGSPPHGLRLGAGGNGAMSIYASRGVAIGDYATTDPGADNFTVVGSIGIGTTSALAKLDVRGDISGSGNFLGTGIGNRITLGGTGYLLSGDVAGEADTLQTVTTRGHTTSTSILSTGPHISGVTGLFSESVGIGTTSPTSFSASTKALHLVGTNAELKAETNNGGGWAFSHYKTPDSDWLVGADGDDKFRISSNGGNLADATLTIETGGNVGIGTTNPDTMLQVYGGDIKLAGSETPSQPFTLKSRYGGFWMVGDGSASNQWIMANSFGHDAAFHFTYTPGSAGITGGIMKMGQQSKNHANYTHGVTAFYTDGAERLRIDGVGNVGIGTTIPTKELSVVGDIYGFKSDGNSAYSVAGVAAIDGNNRFAGLRYDITNDVAKFGHYKNTSLIEEGYIAITTGGLVGIGTTAPTQALTIDGNVNFADTDAHIFGYSATESIRFYNPNNQIILSAADSVRFDTDIRINGNRVVENDAGNGYWQFYDSSYDGFAQSLRMNVPIVVETSEQPILTSRTNLEFRIDSDDNSTTSKFFVTRDTGEAGVDELFKIQENGIISGNGDFYGTGLEGRLTTNGTGYLLSGDVAGEADTLQTVTTRGHTTSTSILSTGPHISGVTGLFSDKVGIGTNNPLEPLHIEGAHYRTVIGSPTTSYGGIGFDTTFTAGNAALRGQAGLTIIGVKGGGSILHQIGNDSVGAGALRQETNKLFYTNGNVGIGTDSPLAMLDVRGDISGSGSFLGTGVGNRITNNGTPYLLSGDAAAALTLQDVCDNGSTTTTSITSSGPHISGVTGLFSDKVGIGKSDPSYPLDVDGIIQASTAGFYISSTEVLGYAGGNLRLSDLGGGMHFRTLGTTKMTVATGGGVGIGTYLPLNKLEVDGGVSITDGGISSPVGLNGLHLMFDEGGTAQSWIKSEQNGSSNRGLQFGASLYNFNYGNVGIGSAAPTVPLDVVANEVALSAATTSQINWYVTPGTSKHFNFYNIRQDSDFQFKQNVGGAVGTDTFVIKGDDGSVGIGTTAPLAKLDVRGSISGSGDFLGTGVGNRITNNGTPYLLSGDAAASLTLQDVTDNGNTFSSDILYTNTGDTAQKIKNSAYGGLMDYWASRNVAFTASSADNAVIHSYNRTQFDFGNAADSSFGTTMTLNNVGNVGIGAGHPATPRAALDVIGTGLFSSGVGIGTTAPTEVLDVAEGNITIDNNKSYKIRNSSDTALQVLTLSASNVLTLGGSSIGGRINFQEGYGTPTMVVSNQRVGIGSATPSTALDVVGEITVLNSTTGVNVGYSNTATAAKSTALGYDNDATGINSTAIGSENTASTQGSAVGRKNHADGEKSTALGYSTETAANSSYSTAVGAKVIISGARSSALGYYTTIGTDDTVEIGQWSSTRAREGAVRIHDNNLVALTMRSGTAPTASSATAGYETSTTLATDMYTIQRNAGDYILYHNDGTSINNVTLGATEADTLQTVTDRGNWTTGNVGIGTIPTNALDVMGHFTATSKSFLIDHPTKENKKLQYASLEGPENAVYVRGTHNGSLIELPEYWSELVHADSLTVVLTPLGKHQNLYVKSKDTAHISVGGVKGSYDYVVYGERKDIDKLEVEPPKV